MSVRGEVVRDLLLRVSDPIPSLYEAHHGSAVLHHGMRRARHASTDCQVERTMAPQYCTMACAARAMPALTAKWSAVRPSRATAVTSVHSPTGERRGRQMSTVCRQPESTAWCSAVNPAASVLLRDTPRCIRLFTCSTGSGHYITSVSYTHLTLPTKRIV